MAVNCGGSSEQVAARQLLMGPPPRGTATDLAARLEVLEAEGLSDADLFGEIQKTLLEGSTTMVNPKGDNNGDTGLLGDDDGARARRRPCPLLVPPRGWYGGKRLGAAGLLLLVSEWRRNRDQYTPYAPLAHPGSPARPHKSRHGGVIGDDAGSPRSFVAPSRLVAPTVWNHRDCSSGGRRPQDSGWLMEPPRHKRWGLGAGIHLRDDLSIATVNQIVDGGIMVSSRTGPVLAPF